MKIFVLGTGRCGTESFIHACRYMENYTATHESRCGTLAAERFQFPDNHIEADNRLSWFLGTLDQKFGQDAFYVHLTRDVEQVAASYNHRWGWRFSIIDAFGYGILHRRETWPEQQRIDVCRFYAETVTNNIRVFLQNRPNAMEVQLECIQRDFTEFWHRIGARGDLPAALATWRTAHNATPAGQRHSSLRSLARWVLRHSPVHSTVAPR